MQPHRYVMLTRSTVTDAGVVERPILINTAHIVSVEDLGAFRQVRLTNGAPVHVTEHWDDFQGFLDSDAPH